MSFSASYQGPADEVRAHIKAASQHEVPSSLREFVLWGINGVKCRYGADAHVSVSISGHLCDDGTSHPATTASVNVEWLEDAVDEPAQAGTRPMTLGQMFTAPLSGEVAGRESPDRFAPSSLTAQAIASGLLPSADDSVDNEPRPA